MKNVSGFNFFCLMPHFLRSECSKILRSPNALSGAEGQRAPPTIQNLTSALSSRSSASHFGPSGLKLQPWGDDFCSWGIETPGWRGIASQTPTAYRLRVFVVCLLILRLYDFTIQHASGSLSKNNQRGDKRSIHTRSTHADSL